LRRWRNGRLDGFKIHCPKGRVGSNPTRRTFHRFVLRSEEEVALVQSLSSSGLNHCQIAHNTGIPRSTVRQWLAGHIPRNARRRVAGCPACGHDTHDPEDLPRPEYPYLLGPYLGDGCISAAHRGVYRLRVFLDMRYSNLISECAAAVRAVMPANVVSIRDYVAGGRCAEVGCFSKSWPCLFPQHGPGPKHLRPIVLTDWQREIVTHHPKPLIRGLIHSDGCRVVNKSMGRRYLRYMFANASADIRSIFCDACDQLGISWRQPKERDISIARRDSVALLDTFVGPKS
jgi:hypothetical protein